MDRINRSRHFIKAATLGVLFCVVLLLSACDSDSGNPGRNLQAAENGEQIFNDNCGPCHGSGGRGPALAELKALSPAERGDRIRNHPVAGTIPQRLPANELIAVIEFFGPE